MSKYRIGVLITLAALAGSLFSVPSFADSQARIVRLSYVEGDVQIDRNAGQGFEKAFLNLPVVQGTRVRAGMNGFAEVEFEDGSTLRLTSGSQVAFPQLEIRDSGAKVSSVDVLRGVVYVAFAGVKDNEFALNFGPEKLTLNRPVHFRLIMGPPKASLAVFKGVAQVDGASGPTVAEKKQTLNFDLSDQGKSTLAKKVEELPYDAWDKDQDDYRQRYARNNAVNNSTYAYGWSDLNYYGNFFNVAGYGTMWQPFFVGAGWDPYMNGAWSWYPGSGYTWVSAYPWGWAPFHSGAWQFIPAYGWVWQPGGAWLGLNNGPRPLNPPSGFVTPTPPATPVRSLIVVNRGPMPTPAVTDEGLVIRRNSAGLGIPRGSIESLNHASVHAQQRGFANATFRSPPAAAMYNPGMSNPGMSNPGMSSAGMANRTASGWSRPSAGNSASGANPGANSHSSAASAPSFHGSSASAPSMSSSSSGGASHSSGSSHK